MAHLIATRPAFFTTDSAAGFATYAVESHARTHGAHQMIAGISAENPAAIAFHAKIGYRETVRIAQAGFKFDRYIDLVLMQKFLS